MFREGFLKTDWCVFNYATNGNDNAEPLLMLHGVTRRWQTFVPLLPCLATRWKVWALDFPGHGKSTSDNSEYLVTDYVAAIVHLLEQRISGSLVIYGHSLGAMVAAGVAALVPHRVRAIVMEDPPFDTMGKRIGESVLQSYFSAMLRHAGSHEPTDEIALALADVQLQNPATGENTRLGELRDPVTLRFAATCLRQLDRRVLEPIVAGRWLAGYDITDVFAEVQCPALLVQADPSVGGLLTNDDVHRIKKACGSITQIQLPNTGHLIHWSSPLHGNCVNGFLESLDGAYTAEL